MFLSAVPGKTYMYVLKDSRPGERLGKVVVILSIVGVLL